MGCESSTNNSYNEGSHIYLESQIREFEIKLGTFSQSFSDIMTRINSRLIADKNNISSENTLHSLGLNYFKETAFKNILSDDILRVELIKEAPCDPDVLNVESSKEAPYNPNTMKLLFFLLTRSNSSENQSDKAKFLYFTLKRDLSEEFDTIVDKDSENFIKLVGAIVHLSTITLVGIKLFLMVRCLLH